MSRRAPSKSVFDSQCGNKWDSSVRLFLHHITCPLNVKYEHVKNCHTCRCKNLLWHIDTYWHRRVGGFLFWFFSFFALDIPTSCSILFTDFKTVFVFALGRFVHIDVNFCEHWYFKTVKWPKNYWIWKLSKNLSKSGKRLTQKPMPSFLGDVGLIKVVSDFLFGHPKCHFWARKDGHFCQKWPS